MRRGISNLAGGAGGASVNFYPTPAPDVSELREIKLCDICCRNFLRKSKEERNCRDCIRRLAEQALQEMKDCREFAATTQAIKTRVELPYKGSDSYYAAHREKVIARSREYYRKKKALLQ